MWDPDKYLDYTDERARPFHDLIAHIDVASPRRVADLGCGPGNLTMTLARRWPNAALEALDASPEMVNAARSRGIEARLGDVRDWRPRQDTDVVVCNAVLHWLPDHRDVLKRWVAFLERGAHIAVQVPGNFDAPSHVLARQLATTRKWSRLLGDAVPGEAADVDDPMGYTDLMLSCGCSMDAWETTYLQRMNGKNPVLEWLSGTALRPIQSALDPPDWDRFRRQLAPMLREAYPPAADGAVWFPFRRVFFIARKR